MDEERIRARNSYRYFSQLEGRLKALPRKHRANMLLMIHEAIDCHNGFRSRTNSIYAAESLALLLRDLKLR